MSDAPIIYVKIFISFVDWLLMRSCFCFIKGPSPFGPLHGWNYKQIRLNSGDKTQEFRYKSLTWTFTLSYIIYIYIYIYDNSALHLYLVWVSRVSSIIRRKKESPVACHPYLWWKTNIEKGIWKTPFSLWWT